MGNLSKSGERGGKPRDATAVHAYDLVIRKLIMVTLFTECHNVSPPLKFIISDLVFVVPRIQLMLTQILLNGRFLLTIAGKLN